jgi:hypothetical protein
MEDTGNLNIIAGDSIKFVANEIEFHSTGDIINIASQKVIKQGETGGRVFGNYTPILGGDTKIEEIITFRFYHRWESTMKKTHHLGNDIITVTEERIMTTLQNNIEIDRNRYVTNYYVHISVDSEVGIAVSTWYYHDRTQYHTVMKDENVTGIAMYEVVRIYADEVAKYKKANRGGSPVQEEAHKNREKNKDNKIILNTTSAIGIIASQIPHVFAKVAGKILSSSKPVVKILLDKPEHADEAAISFTIGYERKNTEEEWSPIL